MTYRVVQVTDGQLDGQGDTAGAVSVVSTAAFTGGQQAVTQVGVDGAAQRPGPAAASVPPGPAAPFPLVGAQQLLGGWRGNTVGEPQWGGTGGTQMLPSGCMGQIPVLHSETLGKAFGIWCFWFLFSCKDGMTVIGRSLRGKSLLVHPVIVECLQVSWSSEA